MTRLDGEGKLLRIFIGENDTWHHQPLYEAIVQKAREEGIAGATVVRGIEGFGASSHLHSARILRLSQDLPLVIEIVDTAEHIDRVWPILDEMVTDGSLVLARDRAWLLNVANLAGSVLAGAAAAALSLWLTWIVRD